MRERSDQLFCSPAIQHFFNSTPMCLLHCSKAIYKAGASRKVCLGTFLLIFLWHLHWYNFVGKRCVCVPGPVCAPQWTWDGPLAIAPFLNNSVCPDLVHGTTSSTPRTSVSTWAPCQHWRVRVLLQHSWGKDASLWSVNNQNQVWLSLHRSCSACSLAKTNCALYALLNKCLLLMDSQWTMSMNVHFYF